MQKNYNTIEVCEGHHAATEQYYYYACEDTYVEYRVEGWRMEYPVDCTAMTVLVVTIRTMIQ